MKQIIQSLSTGETLIEEIPEPSLGPGNILIKTKYSLLSSGTERMLVDFGKANLINKAKQQPDKVKQAISKIQTDGLLPTYQSIQSKLESPIALGYCNMGVIMDIGNDVKGFKLGERVISNGNHAEIVSVPSNLTCKIPDEVSDETALFTVVALVPSAADLKKS